MKKLLLYVFLLVLSHGSLNAITLRNESDHPIEMEVYLSKPVLDKTLSKGEAYTKLLKDPDLKYARQNNYQLSVVVMWDEKPPQFCEGINLKKYDNSVVNEMNIVFTNRHECKIELPRTEIPQE